MDPSAPGIAVGLHLTLALHAGVSERKVLKAGLADELTAHLAYAVRAVLDTMERLIDLLESLVLLAHLTEVLKTHEAVASILVLSGAVDQIGRASCRERV